MDDRDDGMSCCGDMKSKMQISNNHIHKKGELILPFVCYILMMNKEEIRKAGNGTITDPELIREIAKSGELDLYDKVKPGYEF